LKSGTVVDLNSLFDFANMASMFSRQGLKMSEEFLRDVVGQSLRTKEQLVGHKVLVERKGASVTSAITDPAPSESSAPAAVNLEEANKASTPRINAVMAQQKGFDPLDDTPIQQHWPSSEGKIQLIMCQEPSMVYEVHIIRMADKLG